MIRGVALALTVLTGFSGLVYEVAWQKYLATLLGSQSEATAAVLALFLGGLSLGYAVFGRVTSTLLRRGGAANSRLLGAYGTVEGAIGIWALLFPALFTAIQSLSLAVPHASAGAGFGFDVALAAILIAPPAVLMGGTIPVLTQALARGLQDATRVHALVYAFNTAGAFLGALAAGFVLVPQLGLPATVSAMGAVNLLAGASFVLLGRSARARTGAAPADSPVAAGAAGRAEEVARVAASKVTAGKPAAGKAAAVKAATDSPPPVAGLWAYAAAACLCGFGMMAIQTVLNRLGALAFGASHFTFAMVVAAFVLCIAIGSFAVTAAPRLPRNGAFLALAALVVTLVAAYAPLQNTPYWAEELRRRFGHDTAAFYAYYLSAFAVLLAVMLVPIGLSGAVLPLLFHAVKRDVGDLGSAAGRLYSWNTLGSVLGALLGGYALLFWLDLHHVYRLATAALAAAAVVLSVRLLPRRGALAAGAGLGVLLVLLGALPAWNPLRLSSGPFRGSGALGPVGQGPGPFFAAYESRVSVQFYDDDPTTSVAVWQSRQQGPNLSRAIINNGKSDGDIPADYTTMILCGVLPALLAGNSGNAGNAFVIGYGTGVTVGELAALETMQHVEVAEIAHGVVRAAPFFAFGNQDAAASPKVKLVRQDAYRALARSTATYDVIASEPSNPWVTGVEMLFSREFLTTARAHLAPGGVYAQWFHLYETNDETVAMVLRTYQSVFDQVSVWFTLEDDILLLGFTGGDRAGDLDRLSARAEAPGAAAALRRAHIHGVPALLAHELLPAGVLHALPLPGEVHTLFHPRLSHVAAQAFFRGGTAGLPVSMLPEAAPVGARNSLLAQYAARTPGGLPDLVRLEIAQETFKYRPRLAATLLAAWDLDQPGSALLQRATDTFWRDPRHPRDLTPPDFAWLQFLLRGGAAPAITDRAGAERASALFEEYYHHAVPFRRDALAALWANCPPGADTQTARDAVEARLGPLGPPGR